MDYSAISLTALEQRWPKAWGEATGHGVMRQQNDDFVVEEIPLVTPSGEGEHLFLWIEKTGANTAWVAGQLAQEAGIQGRDVSYAGRKDRHARTRQYFSLHLPGKEDPPWRNWQIEGVSILSAARHVKKLRRGALAGNRFQLVIRGVSGTVEQLDKKLERIAGGGVPNYFGPQRFGRNGANIYKAAQLLEQRKRFPRNVRNILVSSARSLVFNDLLAARVRAGTWNNLLPGDIVQLAGSQSRFRVAEPDGELLQRCADFDITATGPLPGDDEPGHEAAEGENTIFEAHAEWVTALKNMRVASDRRPLRLAVKNLHWQHGEQSLQLDFELPAGAYATSVLRELLDCEDAAAAVSPGRED